VGPGRRKVAVIDRSEVGNNASLAALGPLCGVCGSPSTRSRTHVKCREKDDEDAARVVPIITAELGAILRTWHVPGGEPDDRLILVSSRGKPRPRIEGAGAGRRDPRAPFGGHVLADRRGPGLADELASHFEPVAGYDPATYGLRNSWPIPATACK